MNLDQISQPFLQHFPVDTSGNTQQRQTPGILAALTEIEGFQEPKLIAFNEDLSLEIGLGKLENSDDLAFLNAAKVPLNLKSYATPYAGHQFGNWAGQLGDGRAIFAGEIRNIDGEKTELQWKGAGATPYSRHADGRAVLRSSVREFLMSEAIHFLGIPTTRSLSLSFSGEEVMRDILYSGNPAYEKGAVMMRTAPSFLRFGHFELLAAQGDVALLKKLTDYTIDNYFPEINRETETKYLKFFQDVAEDLAALMAEWYRVGFVHGVMNTDNMSILGLTIDYGPFSFLDDYDLNFTSNTTDLPGRRYAFGKQAQIAQWNLWQLANALFPLIKEEKELEKVLNEFSDSFWQKHDRMMAAKFGLNDLLEGDSAFFIEAQQLLSDLSADYTLFFNRLENLEENADCRSLFDGVFYQDLSENQFETLRQFLEKFKNRRQKNSVSPAESKALMQKTNPKFILRNYLLFEAIAELDEGKDDLFQKLWAALKAPYQEVFPEFSQRRPSKYDDQAGCSTLSCSS